jgi:hypothetical protein
MTMEGRRGSFNGRNGEPRSGRFYTASKLDAASKPKVPLRPSIP